MPKESILRDAFYTYKELSEATGISEEQISILSECGLRSIEERSASDPSKDICLIRGQWFLDWADSTTAFGSTTRRPIELNAPYGIEDAAFILGTSNDEIRLAIKEQEIRFYRSGDGTGDMILGQWLLEWLQRGSTPPLSDDDRYIREMDQFRKVEKANRDARSAS